MKQKRQLPKNRRPPPATSVAVAGSIDLTQCGLAGQEANINAQLAERVPAEYGDAGLSCHRNLIGYAAYAGGFGSYTMSLEGKDDHWDLMVANRLKDVGNDTSLTYDINCQVLRGMCDAISSEGGTLYNTIYEACEGNNPLTEGQWSTVGSMQIKYDISGGQVHFSAK